MPKTSRSGGAAKWGGGFSGGSRGSVVPHSDGAHLTMRTRRSNHDACPVTGSELERAWPL